MTIKQQGGIFGRNPSLNDVEIDDLTVTGSSTLNGAFSVQGTAGKLNQTVAGNVLQIAKSMGTESAVVQVGGDRSGDGATYIDMYGTTGGTFGARLIRNGGTNGQTLLQAKGTGGLVVRTDDVAPVIIQTGGAEAARFNTSGNLAFPSGQGIDFSATSGTGTSELLDDYEEGSWSPSWNGGGVTVSYANYVKVGKTVTINFDITLGASSSTSTSTITLPFTSPTIYSAAALQFTSNTSYSGLVVGLNATSITFRSGITGGLLTCAQSDGFRYIGTATYISS